VQFSEPIFFAFFAVYLALHFAVPPRWRICLVIVGSTVFYAWWRVDYVWLPYLLTLIAWFGTHWIARQHDQAARRRRLIITLAALFAPLAAFKYAYFFSNDLVKAIPGMTSLLGDVSALKIALPLGISFITFTLTAYVVDVYCGRFPIARRLSHLLGHVLFFPHLIAGPILRPHELLPQFARWRRAFDARFTFGVALFSIGLVKKLVFADSIAGVVDQVFRPEVNPTGWEYLLAIHGFSMQIYCDFSGYTDMALGVAYIIGIRLPTNFRRPYTARSIVEFWRRWHITLSRWLRDYLYIPLGGNRRGGARQLVNLMTTMVLGGLWHGAAWSFVVWGFLHGAGLAAAHVLRVPMRKWGLHIPAPVGILLTFYFVTLAWIYFRAPDVETAHRVFAGPFSSPWPSFAAFLGQYNFELLLLAVFFATHRFDRHAYVRLAVRRLNRGILWPAIMLLYVIAIIVSQGSSAKFIYFDF
jgi:alginate O-acetyltransferase complex protein AlgI